MDGNQVTTMNTGTAVATTGGDPYAAYGAKVGQTGQFLSFKNGEFLYGQNDTELPIGSRLAANMAGLRIGWRRWFDAKVTDDLTELLIDERPAQRRDELGDNDRGLWETDKDGKPRDPWQLTNVLELVNGAGEQFIYSTGSKGGIGAIGRLCKEYGKLYRQRPGQVPIIELGRDSYTHAEYGKTYFPVFTITGWADENALTIEDADEGGSGISDTAHKPSGPPVPEPASAPAPASSAKKARF